MNIYIMSGIPGSGKSYEANALVAKMISDGETDGVIISTDHEWHQPLLNEVLNVDTYEGVAFNMFADSNIAAALASENYKFPEDRGEQFRRLAEGHATSKRAFMKHILAEKTPNIVIDNTNVWAAEIAPYYEMGAAYSYEVQIVRIEVDLDVAIKRNVHDVPRDVIERMYHVFTARTHQGHLREHMPWWTVLRK